MFGFFKDLCCYCCCCCIGNTNAVVPTDVPRTLGDNSLEPYVTHLAVAGGQEERLGDGPVVPFLDLDMVVIPESAPSISRGRNDAQGAFLPGRIVTSGASPKPPGITMRRVSTEESAPPPIPKIFGG